jgi:hypothetical protein
MFKIMSGEPGTVAQDGSSHVQSWAIMLQQQGCLLRHLAANIAYGLVTLLVNHVICIFYISCLVLSFLEVKPSQLYNSTRMGVHL